MPNEHPKPRDNRTTGSPFIWKRIYTVLASVKLALVLLIVILACCIAGVTIVRDKQAWEVIFSTFWFNSLLILLVVNVAFCFFGRIVGRRLTLVSLGMILFHLSFVAILGGIVYNSLFYFRATIRLTEGETLPNGDLHSYDESNRGRLFDLSLLRGETTLVKMHTKYDVDDTDRRAAYEITVGEGGRKKQGILYITKPLDYHGFRYYNDKEGYSVLVILYDKQGNELYGAHIPLQSLKQPDDAYLYSTGTRAGPGTLNFPQSPFDPLMELQVVYIPSTVKEKTGDAAFIVWPYNTVRAEEAAPLAEGKVAVGERFKAGDHLLEVREVRYWAAMSIRYEPGKPIVLASLWIGLGGMIITFIGRMGRS